MAKSGWSACHQTTETQPQGVPQSITEGGLTYYFQEIAPIGSLLRSDNILTNTNAHKPAGAKPVRYEGKILLKDAPPPARVQDRIIYATADAVIA